jgi:hypothetical protein
MFTRRFILLVGILVTVNVVLFFATPGLALRKAIVNQLFGPSMVRAEVIKKDGSDWRLDRGVITSVDGTQVTLREYDGKVQQIPLTSATIVIRDATRRRLPLSALAKRWHVLVTWQATSSAEYVDVERIPPRHHAAFG